MPTRASTTATVLDRRALNRALLERQLLLRRWQLPAVEAIERLVGLQAQAPNPPYVGLWARLVGFDPQELSQLITGRKVVRIALQRSTIHLVTASDCLALRPLLQPVHVRGLNTTYGRNLVGLDLDAVAAAGRMLVEQQPRTYAELGALLAQQWPDRDPNSLAHVGRVLLPLVQVPPRGIWGASGPAAHTTAESWLGQPLAADPSPEQMVLRYLAAFGPATVRDVQTWSGLTRLGEVVQRLRPQLRTFSDEHSQELFDLPDAPRPDRDTPAAVRLLSEFDNMLLSYADRTRILADEHRKALFTVNGIIKAAVLIDGFVGGLWKINRQRTAATLVIELFERPSAADRAALGAEGEKLLSFAAADADSHDIAFVHP